MATENLRAFSYRTLRYAPNLERDEWVNIGVVLEDGNGHTAARLLEEPAELARVRRLHPGADENVLRALALEFPRELARGAERLERLDQTLSNAVQLGPRHGLLAEDFQAELDRLYRDQVAPPALRRRLPLEDGSRLGIRTRANEIFRRVHILDRLERLVPVESFTQPGDPFRIDYAYRKNGTRGFLHALSLSRDPQQATVLAFTAERIRAQTASVEFTAVTEAAPQAENERHQFVAKLLGGEGIPILPVARLEDFAMRLRPSLS